MLFKSIFSQTCFLLALFFLFSCQPNPEKVETELSARQRRQLERTNDEVMEAKIDSLLNEMTLLEKVGQMTQLNNNVYAQDFKASASESAPPEIQVSIDTNKLIPLIKDYHIGAFLNGIGVSPETWYAYGKQLQELNFKYSRIKIPLIYGMDHVHGANYLDYSTVFPHNINLGATFNDQLSADEARILARETADLGHHWIFAPIMGIGRNPLWPRFYETYGEDPYLCGRMGAAFTRELEKESEDIAPYRQAACVKHYIGYSDPRNGWDRRPAWIPDQHLYEFYVPSFKACIDAGVKTLMVNGGEINGIPVHASHKLLTKLLRDELKFTGVVVTDWEDVRRLYRTHKVVENMEEAVLLAIHAGIDISMTPYTTDFPVVLAKLVQDGKVSMERIDLSVSRILRLKYQLGLFENPFPRNDRFERIASDEHLEKAEQAARESIVLIKNESILPLEKAGKRYVMAGLNADSRMGLSGGWSLRWVAKSDDIFSKKISTFYQSLKTALPESELSLANADNIKSQGANADAIILAVGELPYAEGTGNVSDLGLPDEQLALIRDAQSTGKPVILVMIAGRPRVITKVLDDCQAFIWAGLPGYEGGKALASILIGDVNPSGKMPFSYPAYATHMEPYNYKNMARFDMPNRQDTIDVIASFGEGLSYTKYEYSGLKLSSKEIDEKGEIVAKVQVKNTGDRDGMESVLWFVRDEVGSVTRPVRALKFYEKKLIKAGESQEFEFIIRPKQDLGFPDEEGNLLLEKGAFTLMVGDQKARFDLKLPSEE